LFQRRLLNKPQSKMLKFKCEYEDGDVLLSAKIWKLTVEADDHRQAYEKFIKEVGIFKYRVYVGKGFKGKYFSDHIKEVINNETEKIIEKEKEVVIAKESFDEQISEITKKQGLNKPESSTEKLLIKIIDLQQNQFGELKKLNFKLLMFWIILVVLPLLGWLLTQ